ncbi:MAG TPA: J domain-containing protein [Desulfobacterales bacterium]
MYLARKIINGKIHYFIRETFRHHDQMCSRELFSLGTDPRRFIVYPGGNAYYIDETVTEALDAQGVESDFEDLDDLFWDFLRPRIRYKLEPFRLREKRSRRAREAPAAVNEPRAFHPFDRRRILFLKTGQMDQRGLDRLPSGMLKVLVGKSRDELEQMFLGMEGILRAGDVKKYVFTIFDLQSFFRTPFARKNPEILDPTEVDDHFIEMLCRLNGDGEFWSGFEREEGLHEYLIRYALMFFDYEYENPGFMQDYLRDFRNRHREFHPPPQPGVPMQEAGDVFEETPEALTKMSCRELTRLFRRRAQDLHPDKGGDSKQFIRLTEAYRTLMRRKR